MVNLIKSQICQGSSAAAMSKENWETFGGFSNAKARTEVREHGRQNYEDIFKCGCASV